MQAHAQQIAALAALANGIIPADEVNSGAAAVDAGPRLAEKLVGGPMQQLYLSGLAAAEKLARSRHAPPVPDLTPAEIHELLGVLAEESPRFFLQLRADVAALYLGDENIWQQIGFPGPSAEQGGYPDFDRRQTTATEGRKNIP